MAATMLENTTKTFKFSFPTCTSEDLLFKLEVPVAIPYPGSTRELVQRVLKMFHIPVYLEDELNEKLSDFVSEETKNFHDDRDARLIDQLKNNELDLESVVKNWEKQFKNVVDFAEQKGSSDEEVFAAAYHKLVHSPALETILQVESAYAKTVMDMTKNRDDDIKRLTKRQTEEMEEKIRLLNTSTTEEEINALATKHFEEQSLAAGRWESQLDALKHTQRAEHRSWLMNAINEYQTEEKITPSASPLASFGAPAAPLAAPPAYMEESFTIQLGSQLKQTHNIRLVCADMLELCAPHPTDGGSWALYSGELSGLVLLSGARPSRSPLLALPRPTDHHFPDLPDQLRRIEEAVAEPSTRRAGRGAQQGARGGRARAAAGRRVRDAAQLAGPARRVPPGGGRGGAARRAELAPRGRAGAARRAAGGAARRRVLRGAAAAAAARAGRRRHGGVVPAARRAGAQVRQGLHAGGERGRRRAAAHADGGAAGRGARAVRAAGRAAARRVPRARPAAPAPLLTLPPRRARPPLRY